jgi:hypothetical protein
LRLPELVGAACDEGKSAKLPSTNVFNMAPLALCSRNSLGWGLNRGCAALALTRHRAPRREELSDIAIKAGLRRVLLVRRLGLKARLL